MMFTLLACLDLSDSGRPEVWVDGSIGDSGDTGGSTAGPPEVSLAWDESGVSLTVVGGSARYYALGLAETGSSGGWYGEDCIAGPGPNSGDYDICHDAVSAQGGRLETVRSPDDVLENETTLFPEVIADAGNITYVLYDGANCWTLGHDPSYYIDSLGCAGLDP